MPRHENLYNRDIQDFKGFIPFKRQLLTLIPDNRPLSKAEAVLDLFHQLQGPAKYDSTRKIHLKENERIISISRLATRWKWNRKRVTRFTDWLQKQNIVKKTTKGRQGDKYIIFLIAREIVHEEGQANDHEDDHDNSLKINELNNISDHGQGQGQSWSNVHEEGHIPKDSIVTILHTLEAKNLEPKIKAIRYLKYLIKVEQTVRFDEKLKQLKDFELLMVDFEHHFEVQNMTLQLTNDESRNGFLKYFDLWLDIQIAELRKEASGENTQNNAFNRAVQYFKLKFNKPLTTDEVRFHLGALMKAVKENIKLKKKQQGHLYPSPTEDEKFELFKQICDNLPQFYLERVSVKIIASNFNSILSEIETVQSPTKKFNLPDPIEMNSLEKWHEFKDRIIDIKTYEWFIDYEGSRTKRVESFKLFKKEFEQRPLEVQMKILKTA